MDADPDRGSFVTPTVVRVGADVMAPHEIEAFGPVASLMTYDDLGRVEKITSYSGDEADDTLLKRFQRIADLFDAPVVIRHAGRSKRVVPGEQRPRLTSFSIHADSLPICSCGITA